MYKCKLMYYTVPQQFKKPNQSLVSADSLLTGVLIHPIHTSITNKLKKNKVKKNIFIDIVYKINCLIFDVAVYIINHYLYITSVLLDCPLIPIQPSHCRYDQLEQQIWTTE